MKLLKQLISKLKGKTSEEESKQAEDWQKIVQRINEHHQSIEASRQRDLLELQFQGKKVKISNEEFNDLISVKKTSLPQPVAVPKPKPISEKMKYTGGDPIVGDIIDDENGHQFQVKSVALAETIGRLNDEVLMQPYNFNWSVTSDRSLEGQIEVEFFKFEGNLVQILSQTSNWVDNNLPARFVYFHDTQRWLMFDNIAKQENTFVQEIFNWQDEKVRLALIETTKYMKLGGGGVNKYIPVRDKLEPEEEEKLDVFLSKLKIRAEIVEEVKQKIKKGEEVRTDFD